MIDWCTQSPIAVTLIDTQGRVVEMNDSAAQSYTEDGGRKLVGANSLDCHPAEARDKLISLLQSQQANVYSIEKAGQRTLIYQGPWFEDGQFRGMIELQIALPQEVPNFKRD